MYVIIDWMTFGFVMDEHSGSVRTWANAQDAKDYATQNLQSGLWQILVVPPIARPFKP